MPTKCEGFLQRIPFYKGRPTHSPTFCILSVALSYLYCLSQRVTQHVWALSYVDSAVGSVLHRLRPILEGQRLLVSSKYEGWIVNFAIILLVIALHPRAKTDLSVASLYDRSFWHTFSLFTIAPRTRRCLPGRTIQKPWDIYDTCEFESPLIESVSSH